MAILALIFAYGKWKEAEEATKIAMEQIQKIKIAVKEANDKNKQFLNEKISTKKLEINDLQRKNEIYKSSNGLELINENKQKL